MESACSGGRGSEFGADKDLRDRGSGGTVSGTEVRVRVSGAVSAGDVPMTRSAESAELAAIIVDPVDRVAAPETTEPGKGR